MFGNLSVVAPNCLDVSTGSSVREMANEGFCSGRYFVGQLIPSRVAGMPSGPYEGDLDDLVNVARAEQDDLTSMKRLRRAISPDSIKAAFFIVEPEMAIPVRIYQRRAERDVGGLGRPRGLGCSHWSFFPSQPLAGCGAAHRPCWVLLMATLAPSMLIAPGCATIAVAKLAPCQPLIG